MEEINYKKKYEEALERAKKMLDSKRSVVIRKQAIEHIFPELAESKDERTRKWIIDLLGSFRTKDRPTECLQKLDDAIAYLEKQKGNQYFVGYAKGYSDGQLNPKQKEQKPVKCELEDAFKYYTDAGITVSCGDIVAKPKEQKPVKKEITLTDFEETLNTFLFYFANSPIEDCEPKEYIKKHSAEILKAAYKELNAQLQQDIFEAKQEGRREGYEVAKAEQKPAERSLEDDHTIGFVYDLLNEIEWRDSWAMSKDECLRLLKNYSPQPKPEWSEEDEKMLNLAIEWAETMSGQFSFVDMNSTDFRKIIAWLKSLRPQYHGDVTMTEAYKMGKEAGEAASWKPSEEQLEAFRSYIKDFQEKAEAAVGGWNNFDVMIRLFEQLKKLM